MATLRLTTSYGPVAFDAAIPLRQRPGKPVGNFRGSRAEAMTLAATRARRDGNMVAVVEAARGRYYLVPLHMQGSSGNPSIDAVRELVDVPGMQTLALWTEADGLVAIVDHRRYLTPNGRRSVIARG